MCRDMVELNRYQVEEFKIWQEGNITGNWVINDSEVFNSRYIDEVKGIEQIDDEEYMVIFNGEVAVLSYM